MADTSQRLEVGKMRKHRKQMPIPTRFSAQASQHIPVTRSCRGMAGDCQQSRKEDTKHNNFSNEFILQKYTIPSAEEEVFVNHSEGQCGELVELNHGMLNPSRVAGS